MKNKRIIFEDNKGGDVIEISDNGDGTYEFTVANCCVYVIKINGTISEITKELMSMSCAYEDYKKRYYVKN